MNDIDAIREIEAIKQLKARYCRFLDAKDWVAWRGLFTEDFVSDTIESGGRLITGADEFVAFVRRMLGAPGRTTVHHIHAPEIELDSPATAHGIWAMEDFVRFVPGLNLRGYGHYDETYEKVGADWRIRSSKLTRLRMDLVTPLLSVKLPARRR